MAQPSHGAQRMPLYWLHYILGVGSIISIIVGAGNGLIIQSYTFSESPLNFQFIGVHCNDEGQLKKYL